MTFQPSEHMLRPIGLPELPPLVDVGPEGIIVGRDPKSTVVIPADRFPQVSGQHARIEVRAGDLYLQDLGSKNGTIVNRASVETAELKKNDVIQLGIQGPQFRVVERSSSSNSTIQMREADLSFSTHDDEGEPDSNSYGDHTLLKMKRALGIPEGASGVQGMLRAGRLRLLVVCTVLVVIAAVAITWIYLDNQRTRRDDLAALQEIINRQQREIERQREALESRELDLLRQIERLRVAGQTSVEELRRLEAELEKTREKLGGPPIDPADLADSDRRPLEMIIPAVVLIETRVAYWSRRESRDLYATRDTDGKPRFNFDGRGERYVRNDSGSGFCVSPEGWILTNRHVVAPRRAEELERFDLEPRVEIWVVFDGRSRRRAGKAQPSPEIGVDLALVKVDPYPDMPFVPGFDPGAPSPPQASEVFLVGFPYGTHTLQNPNDAVSASIFRGIVSREVQGLIQVTAGVYPGNSGGPLVNPAGQVVGVVTGVQTLPDGVGMATNIGYAIPILQVRSLWPPRASDKKGG